MLHSPSHSWHCANGSGLPNKLSATLRTLPREEITSVNMDECPPRVCTWCTYMRVRTMCTRSSPQTHARIVFVLHRPIVGEWSWNAREWEMCHSSSSRCPGLGTHTLRKIYLHTATHALLQRAYLNREEPKLRESTTHSHTRTCVYFLLCEHWKSSGCPSERVNVRQHGVTFYSSYIPPLTGIIFVVDL